jgi:hypothetical protein
MTLQKLMSHGVNRKEKREREPVYMYKVLHMDHLSVAQNHEALYIHSVPMHRP